jgi:hypothetical protein
MVLNYLVTLFGGNLISDITVMVFNHFTENRKEIESLTHKIDV